MGRLSGLEVFVPLCRRAGDDEGDPTTLTAGGLTSLTGT